MRWLGSLLLLGAVANGAAAPPPDTTKLLHGLPLRFEQDTHSRWVTRGPGFAALFDQSATVLRMSGRTLRLSFTGSNPTAEFEAAEPQQAQTNYFIGKQYRSVQAFSRLHQIGVYPGVDVAYYGNGERLEYDFNLQPGADPSRIRMRFEGADDVSVNKSGDLVLQLGTGEMVQKAPVVYQRRSSGEVVAIESRYRIVAEGEVGVTLGNYDRSEPLVIDPAMLYGLYLTGTNADGATAIAVDPHGIVYLGGYTYSTDFPLGGTSGYQLFPPAGVQSAWIWKLNPFASNPNQVLLYSTYFAANLNTNLTSLAVDANGVVYFGGITLASNLPVTSGAFQSALANTNATSEGYVAVLDTTQSGTAGLLYCSYYSGSQITQINGVATLGGRVYVTGFVNSNDLPLAGNSFQASQGGGYDAFVAEFDPTQSGEASLLFATYLGGFLTDVGRAIAVDQFGVIYVTGYTLAPDFPTTINAYQRNYNSGGDAFLAEIDPLAGVLRYSSFLGGSGSDVATSITVEQPGRVAIAGYTYSTDFPITSNAAQSAYGGNGDAFVMSVNLNAQSRAAMLAYSSYYGGNDSDVAYGISRDPSGRYHICGYTLSQNLPVSAGAINPVSVAQTVDAFLAVLDPAAGLAYGSYITGPGYQIAYAIATDASGNAYVTGQTTSDIFAHGPPKVDDPGNIDVFFTVVAPTTPSSSSRERTDVFRGGAEPLKSDPFRAPRESANK